MRAIVHLWWLIMLTTLAGGAGGYAVYHQATPLYQTSVQLIVTGASDARLVANQRASALSAIAVTPPAVQDALVAAGYPNATPQVTSVANGHDPFITISVVATNANIAQALANAFGKSLPATGARLDGSAPSGLGLAIVAPAGLPGAPFSPNPRLDIGMGLVAGFILGVAVAILRDTMNRAVRDNAELERLTGLTGLGTVPRGPRKVLMPINADPRGPRAEAYRQIRTSVENSSTKRPRIIAVTSAVSGEGKTSVATNVAAAFSRAGHRVAIVDADLRRPTVADYFQLPSHLGLTDVLSGGCTLDEALTVLDDGRLLVLTAGPIPANPSEALSGLAMDRVLRELTARCEFVFIDTPPVLPVTDALVLAPKVSGVILVFRLGHTSRGSVKQTMASIARVNADIIGVVPNQASKGLDSDYGYQYTYTYPTRRGEPALVEIKPETLQAAADGHVEPRSIGGAPLIGPDPRRLAATNGHAKVGSHRAVSQRPPSASEQG